MVVIVRGRVRHMHRVLMEVFKINAALHILKLRQFKRLNNSRNKGRQGVGGGGVVQGGVLVGA